MGMPGGDARTDDTAELAAANVSCERNIDGL